MRQCLHEYHYCYGPLFLRLWIENFSNFRVFANVCAYSIKVQMKMALIGSHISDFKVISKLNIFYKEYTQTISQYRHTDGLRHDLSRVGCLTIGLVFTAIVRRKAMILFSQRTTLQNQSSLFELCSSDGLRSLWVVRALVPDRVTCDLQCLMLQKLKV